MKCRGCGSHMVCGRSAGAFAVFVAVLFLAIGILIGAMGK